MLCKSFKIIDSQSSASDTIPLCFSTASKIKNIKCPAVNQKWWDRLMKKTPRFLNINVHHWPALENWTHDYWKRTGLNVFLYLFDPFVSLCIKSKFVLSPSRKILDVFIASHFIITEFPENIFFLKNFIFYFMIVPNFKFENFYFLIFKFLLFLLKKGDL